MNSTEIGKRIKLQRDVIGISQSELARRLSVSPQTVQKWESGGNPRTTRLQAIAGALGCDISDLTGGGSSGPDAEWPFKEVRFSDYMALSDQDKREIIGLMKMKIEANKFIKRAANQ